MTTATPESKSAHAAKLQRITIEGFRSIKELDLKFNDLAVLIGANGSGKSNLLAFFDMMRHMFSHRLQLYVGIKGGGSSILHYGPKHTPLLKAKLELSNGAGLAEHQFTLQFAQPDRMFFAEEYVGYTAPQGTTYTHGMYHPTMSERVSLDHVDYESSIDELINEPGNSNGNTRPAVYSARLQRATIEQFQIYHFHDTSDRAPVRTLQDINGNRGLAADGSNLAAYLYMLRETKAQYFNRIVSTIRLAIPYFNNFILEPDPLSDNKRILLRWQDKRLDYAFGPHQLSDGSLRTIALITLLLQPKEMLPGIILLDEPELGLRPSAVGLVGGLINAVSVDRQVIVATQSARLLSEFRPEDVVVVEREEDMTGSGESTFKRLTTADLGEWVNEYDLGTLYEMNVTGGGPQ